MNMSLHHREVESEPARERASSERHNQQYSLATILGIWALAAVPMGILGWIVAPLLAPDVESDPLGAGVARLALLMLGLIWLFVLSMLIVVERKAICAGRRSSAGSGSLSRGSQQPASLGGGSGCGWYRSLSRSRW